MKALFDSGNSYGSIISEDLCRSLGYKLEYLEMVADALTVHWQRVAC